jgi:glycerol-3-phosphate dehydrogenase (NAD(P)+)
LLTEGGHAVTIWGAFPESVARLSQTRENPRLLPGVKIPGAVRLTASESDCFDGCTLILSAVPTQYMRAAWTRLRPHYPAATPVVSVSKGIENSTLLRPTELIADVLAARPALAAVSGPNLAVELARQLPATAVAASEDPEFAQRVQAAFSSQWFRVYTNSDLLGTELAGATKNVIAIAAGILDGLSAGNNAKAALITRGLVEITRLGVAMGASEETFAGLAGLGDLIATCVSPEGRNRAVGHQIGQGKKLADILAQTRSVAEGVATSRSVHELAGKFGVEMPITQAVYQVLFEGKGIKDALNGLMSREKKPERLTKSN